MFSRRAYLRTVGGTAITAAAPTRRVAGDDSDEGDDNKEPCCSGIVEDDDEQELRDDPDFVVEAETGPDADCYWRSAEYFDGEYDPYTVAVAYTSDKIELNRGMADSISNTVIAHEYGHIIGYAHREETLMDPVLSAAKDSGPPTNFIEREIIRTMDGSRLIDWDLDGKGALLDIAANFRDDHADADALLYAATRFREEADHDAYYLTDWDHFGGESQAKSQSGEFFR